MGSNSYSILRGVNYSRIVLYGIAIWIQSSLFIACVTSGGYCDIFTILVPIFMVFLDMMMVRSSRNPFSWFLLASLLVSLLSVYMAFQTLFTIIFYRVLLPNFYLTPITIEERLMGILSLGVFFVSFIEIMILIYLTRPQEQKDEDVLTGTTRTYDAQ